MLLAAAAAAAADASVLLCSGTMETMMREQARKGQWRPELPSLILKDRCNKILSVSWDSQHRRH
jgi:hypothetical protein